MTEKKTTVAKVFRPQLIATTFKTSRGSMQGIRLWNIVLALLYGSQAIILAVIAKGVSVPVAANYVTKDPLQSAAQNKTVLTLASHHLFDINLLWLIVAALAIAAVANVLIVTRFRARYEADLANERAPLRWLQYTITSSLITLILTLVSGVQDVALLVAVVAGSLVFHLGCLFVERLHVRGEPFGKLLYTLGLGTGIGSVVGLVAYVIAAARCAEQFPTYIYWLMISMFVAFVLLVGNFLLQRLKISKWRDFVFGERVCMVLAFVTQSLLAWQVYAGMLH